MHSLFYLYELNFLALVLPYLLPLFWWCWVTRRTFRTGIRVQAEIIGIRDLGLLVRRRTFTCALPNASGNLISGVKLHYNLNQATTRLRVGDRILLLQDPSDSRRCFFPVAYGKRFAA